MCSAIIAWMVALLVFSACTPSHKDEVDKLNSMSYVFHYRNLDSARVYASQALKLSDDYPSGMAEAYNNLAFVDMARMNYALAEKHLDKAVQVSDNQIEILVAFVQRMRLCQRQSHNKDFYAHREAAMRLLRRIGEEAGNLPVREKKRVLYARSEFDVVSGAYFYYVGQQDALIQALKDIDAEKLEADTAQYLNYLYNIGSGGVIVDGTAEQIAQTEFDYLVRCLLLASDPPVYPYWQANALQAISEHMQNPTICRYLVRNNLPTVKYINVDQVPDSLLAGNMALSALNIFKSYGDVYQTAGAYRTLAECYWAIGDYSSAGTCLNHALYDNKAINAAPDLVASICERLCLVYSAIDDKPHSDENRNKYLDLQEQTRQDRQLEARATMLDHNAVILNWMIAAVICMIVLVVILLFVFDRMRRKGAKKNTVQQLLEPLEEWRHANEEHVNSLNERKEEIEEATEVARMHLLENKKRHLEQRAKIELVNSIMPFIDRMMHEADRLSDASETETQKQERLNYIAELTEKINQYNNILTEWIQMRQGTLNLHITSFALQPLFDIVQKAKTGFAMSEVELHVEPTLLQVKADRTLTLFMVNTIADNARKFTPKGGKVSVRAVELDQSIEIRVTDTGQGMDAEQVAHVFDHTYTGGHGFGLLNCKGIIEKYKKVSSIFSVCTIGVDSEPGKGSSFFFRLPKGGSAPHAARTLKSLLLIFALNIVGAGSVATMAQDATTSAAVQLSHHHGTDEDNLSTPNLRHADAFADSVYFANVNGRYAHALALADSARHYLNLHYLSLRPQGKVLMTASPSEYMAAEILWYHDSLPTNYYVILDIRNESAVAALALHKWALYQSNNNVYTQLYREMGADNSLPGYVRTMQVSENSKTVAVVLLILMLMLLPIAYYLLYYRHVLFFRFAVDKLHAVNEVLLSDLSDQDKLSRIEALWHKAGVRLKGMSVQVGQAVEQIEEALRESVQRQALQMSDIEMAEDELHKDEYENARLHVSNSVLDNTLSSLKHETMYYPSRIQQLVNTKPDDTAALHELVDYYKTLYSLLSAQAHEQTALGARRDPDMTDYLFSILQREGGGELLSDEIDQHNYRCLRFSMPKLTSLSDAQIAELFTPTTVNVKFLLCRQIVRELGEVSNMRGCGISALRNELNDVVVNVVMV